MGGGGEVRQKRLYSRLTSAQKRQKCKFVPKLLSMIADSRPSKLLSLWLVLSPLSASSSNGQVLHLVWCSLRALMTLKSPKKLKTYSRKNRWFKNHAKVNAYFRDIDSRIMGKINPHSRFTQSKNAHSRVTKKVEGTL